MAPVSHQEGYEIVLPTTRMLTPQAGKKEIKEKERQREDDAAQDDILGEEEGRKIVKE